jgi:hypothetical protein
MLSRIPIKDGRNRAHGFASTTRLPINEDIKTQKNEARRNFLIESFKSEFKLSQFKSLLHN